MREPRSPRHQPPSFVLKQRRRLVDSARLPTQPRKSPVPLATQSDARRWSLPLGRWRRLMLWPQRRPVASLQIAAHRRDLAHTGDGLRQRGNTSPQRSLQLLLHEPWRLRAIRRIANVLFRGQPACCARPPSLFSPQQWPRRRRAKAYIWSKLLRHSHPHLHLLLLLRRLFHPRLSGLPTSCPGTAS